MQATLRCGTSDKEGALAPKQEAYNDVEHGVISAPNTSDDAIDENAAKAKKRVWVRTSPDSPRNWPAWRKWSIIWGLTFYTSFAFLGPTAFITDAAAARYGVSEQVSILGQSMNILGLAIGPMFLAPLSEIYGRKLIITISMFFFAILQIPTALSPTFTGVAITRFLSGCAGGIPDALVGACAADLFPSPLTGWPIMMFSFATQVLGPDLGPVIGGAFYVATGSIHWLYWMLLILGMVAFVWSLTFGETLHDRAYAKHTGIKKQKSAVNVVQKEIFRAFYMLFTEPIVIALALTTTYLFGMIYIYLEAYPLVYEDGYDFNSIQEGAMFLTAIGGGILALGTQPLQNYLWRRTAAHTSDGQPRPEARLYTACFSVWCLPASIFWFTFTSTEASSVSYQLPMWSGFLFGYAEVATYTGIWQYITDAYDGEFAGSALAACSAPALTIGAALTHVAVPMFNNEGIKWALATLAFISLGFLAVPPLLIWKGPALRARSRFAIDTSPSDG